MTDFPQQKEWKVLSVREGDEEANPHGGTLKKFYVDFEGCDDVYWRRKMPAEIKVGETYFGTISQGKFGPMFKKEAPEGGSSSSGGSQNFGSKGSARSYKPESEFDPEKVARIGRAHAQKCAVWLLAASGGLTDVNSPTAKAHVKDWADWFEADVNAAAERARGQAPVADYAQPVTRDVVEPTIVRPDERDQFVKTFEDKALHPESAHRLADFVMRMTPEQRTRAWTGLTSFDTEMDTLKKLEDSFKQHEGEALPVSTPFDPVDDPAADEIPF